MTSKRLVASGVLALTLFAAPLAHAGTSLTDVTTSSAAITATLTEIGTRSVAAVGAITFTGGLSSALTSTYNVLVTEVARTGTNPWSITAQVCGGSGTPDCATKANNLYNGATALAASNISASSQTFANATSGSTVLGTVVPTGSGGGTLAAGSFADLGTSRTLGTNSAQSTTTAYTGGYQLQGNLSLTLPNGTSTGAYAGYFVVTLVQ